MKIPTWPQHGERESELLATVLDSPQWGGFHPFITEFEQSFATYQHAAHGVSVFNGTVALELALNVLGIGPGDEVVVPAISFISTATAVSRVGAVPVFADVERDSFNLDPARISEALSGRTRALITVHFGGTMCKIDEISRICHEHNLFLIEDAAHAQGSEWNGQRAGSFGVVGAFSFQNGKVLCSGEGGMLVSSNDSFAEIARSVANCGRTIGSSFYEHHRVGSNYRLSAFQAAVLLAQFERLPEQIRRRTANAQLLKDLLKDVEEIVWQAQPPQITQNSFYLLTGRVRGPAGARDAFHRTITAGGVPCTPFYPHTIYANPAYRHASCRVMPCPVAEESVADAFWLPHRVLLAEENTIRQIADVVK